MGQSQPYGLRTCLVGLTGAAQHTLHTGAGQDIVDFAIAHLQHAAVHLPHAHQVEQVVRSGKSG